MKKTLLNSLAILALIFVINSNTNAQYKKGDKLLNAGIGLRSFFIPISASLELGITDKISVGPLVGFAKWSSYSGNVTYIGARGSYHVNELLNFNNDKVDLYAGAGLFYQKWSYDDLGYLGSLGSGLGFMGFIGGRYYFQNSLGAFAELGGGISAVNAGITLKF